MSKHPRARRSLRVHLSYANVMATMAVFIALGGGAYAATALPPNSVGKAQLRTHAVARSNLAKHAVSRSKLAKHAVGTGQVARSAVTFNRLSKWVRSRLHGRSGTGPKGDTGLQGPKGDPGPRGPAGVDALGARRLRFDTAATASSTPTTVLNMPGLQLEATCTLSGADVGVELRARAPADTVLQSTFTVDSGADPANPPQPGDPSIVTASDQIALAANTYTTLGGPGTQNGTGYVRANARAIAVSESETITLDLFEIINADTGRCSIGGTALPSS